MTDVIACDWLTLGTDTPRIRIDASRFPVRHLTVDGVPAYTISQTCGTCGLMLRRQPGRPAAPDRPAAPAAPAGQSAATAVQPGATADRISAIAVRDRLNTGLDQLDPEVVDAFAAQLPRADYLVMLLDAQPQPVTPGSTEDYFTVDGPAGWYREEHRSSSIDNPTNVTYYRLGQGPYRSHDTLFQFVVPFIDPERLDKSTVGRYVEGATANSDRPTAVALGLLDHQGPYFRAEQHAGLFHFLLDGHHKIAAAARTGRPARLLTFVSARDSLTHDTDLRNLPTALTAI